MGEQAVLSRWAWRVAVICLAAASSCTFLRAQATGSISGTVTDPTGAAARWGESNGDGACHGTHSRGLGR
jgi:hypothetical protein